jgi:[acyl-carrier-protein] S-malonyltransferase
MTTQVAFLFPGQGSQAVGMGLDAYEQSVAAKHVFSMFDAALDFPLSQLCFNGPVDTLRSTVHAQPAIVAVSLAYLAAFQEALSPQSSSWSFPLRPKYTAGHSVGECAALVVAGVLDLAQVACLVRERGRLMHAEEEACEGGMAAVIGVDAQSLHDICQQATCLAREALTGVQIQHPGMGKVIIANYNAPGQIVISGERRVLEMASKLAVERGARKVIPLSVSGAFHSPVMAPAATRLAQLPVLSELREATIPVIGNMNAKPLTTRDELRTELSLQVAASVQWVETIEYLGRAGVTAFFEIGPGQTLAGMVKRIIKGATIINVGTMHQVQQAVTLVREQGLLS